MVPGISSRLLLVDHMAICMHPFREGQADYAARPVPEQGPHGCWSETSAVSSMTSCTIASRDVTCFQPRPRHETQRSKSGPIVSRESLVCSCSGRGTDDMV